MRALMPPAVTTAIVRRSIGRSLRTGLASISVCGSLPAGPAVIAANHQSWWDGYVLGSLSVRAGAEPVIVMTARQLGRFPFLRTVGAVAPAELREAARRTSRGAHTVIFPEGTREKENAFLPLKSGLFVVAAAAGVDVVPCRIHYDTPDGRMKPFCRVRVVYGEPMPAARFSMEGRRDLRKLRENKQAVLEAWEKL